MAWTETPNAGAKSLATASNGPPVSVHHVLNTCRGDEAGTSTGDTEGNQSRGAMGGSKPLRCGPAIWIRRPEWAGLL